jgi:leucyl aminopeptidase
MGGKEYATVTLTDARDRIVEKDGKTLIELSIGDREEMTRRKFVSLVRRVVASAKSAKLKKVALVFADFRFPTLALTDAELAELIAVNLEMANFEFVKYKTKPKDGWNTLIEVMIVGKLGKDAEAGLRKGRIIGEEVNATRTLANTPGGDMTPSILGEAAHDALRGLPVDVKVLDEIDMKEPIV